MGSNYKEKRILDDKEKSDALKSLKDFQANIQKGNDIVNLSFVKKDLTKHISIIELVVDTYKSYSKDTFCYFYLQYLHQYRFPFHLKIAVQREKDFDYAFRTLQKLDDISETDYYLYGAYLRDYFVYLKGEKKSIIPYYFPSGNIR